MQIRRLTWAGIKIVVDSTTVVVDLLEETDRLRAFMGEPHGPIATPEGEHSVHFALVTHLHPDHYDPSALRKRLAPLGRIICHRAILEKITSDGLPAEAVELEEPLRHDGVVITAVPAVDGFGDPQVSWIVEGDGKKIIHCGDTLWHGHWWRTRRNHGPFDAAFLCINGAVMVYPGLEPSGLPADMTPEQAAAAGKLLAARTVCPIHYGSFNARQYCEAANAEETFLAAAHERGINVQIVPPGDFLRWDSN